MSVSEKSTVSKIIHTPHQLGVKQKESEKGAMGVPAV